MMEKSRANSLPLARDTDVGMSDEGHVLYMLNAHDAEDLSCPLIHVEADALSNPACELLMCPSTNESCMVPSICQN